MTASPFAPDVIIPGFMKSGTSSLHTWLTDQPEFARSRKEPNYYSNDSLWEKGSEWHREFLADEPEILTVDASPRYLGIRSAKVAKRISETAPDAPVVVLYRDPLDRAISHFVHTVRVGRSDAQMADAAGALTLDSHFVQSSGYANRIHPFLSEIAQNNLMFLHLDKLADEGWDQLLIKLGLPCRPIPTDRANVAADLPRQSAALKAMKSHRLRTLSRYAPKSLRILGKGLLLSSPLPKPPPIDEIRATMPQDARHFLDEQWQEFLAMTQSGS